MNRRVTTCAARRFNGEATCLRTAGWFCWARISVWHARGAGWAFLSFALGAHCARGGSSRRMAASAFGWYQADELHGEIRICFILYKHFISVAAAPCYPFRAYTPAARINIRRWRGGKNSPGKIQQEKRRLPFLTWRRCALGHRGRRFGAGRAGVSWRRGNALPFSPFETCYLPALHAGIL